METLDEFSPGRIKRLRVKNYRSLANVEILLDPVTVFVGPNGAGKSNVLDALRFVRDALKGTLEQAIAIRGGMSSLRRWSPKGRPFDVSIEMEVEGPEWNAEYGFVLGSRRKGEFSVKREACKVSFRGQDYEYVIEKGEFVKKPSVVPFVEDFVKSSLGEDDDVENFREQLYQVQAMSLFLPKAATLLGIAPYTLLWLWFTNMAFYNLYPNAFKEPQKPGNPYPLLDDGSNLVSHLKALRRDHPRNWEQALAFLKEAVPGLEEVSTRQVGGYLIAQVLRRMDSGDSRRRAAFSLAQESDGTLRLLALFVALFQKPARSLIGIEEPELNVHPGALPVLRDAITLASEHTQILITTHSPELLEEFPAEAFRIVDMVDGRTVIGPMAEHQQEAVRERLFTPGELLVLEGLQREGVYA